jgi:hypothetical protein
MLIASPIKPFVDDFFICLDKAWGMFSNNDEVIWALKYIAMSNALAFKSYPTSKLCIHLESFFSCLSPPDIVVSVVICNHLSDRNMQQVDDMTSTYMVDFGYFLCLFGCSGIPGLLGVEGVGEFFL